jgi:hypothetical protein
MSYCANISKFQTNTIPPTHKYITTHFTGLVQAFQEKSGWAKQAWWAQNENEYNDEVHQDLFWKFANPLISGK